MNYLQYDKFNTSVSENMKGHEYQCRRYLHECPDKCKEGSRLFTPASL